MSRESHLDPLDDDRYRPPRGSTKCDCVQSRGIGPSPPELADPDCEACDGTGYVVKRPVEYEECA